MIEKKVRAKIAQLIERAQSFKETPIGDRNQRWLTATRVAARARAGAGFAGGRVPQPHII